MTTEPSQASASFCQECGCKLDPGTKFCPNCGTPVRSAPLHAKAVPASPTLNGRSDYLTCDYYELLGIGRGSDLKIIRKSIVSSFEQVASWPDSPEKAAVLKRLKEARDTLTDDDARAKYAVELYSTQNESSQKEAGSGQAADKQIQPVSQAAQAGSGPAGPGSADASARNQAHASQTNQSGQVNPPVVYATVVQQAQKSVNDSGSFGWAVLGFFIPLVGLILWLVWKDEKPETARRCIHGAVVSVIISILLYLIGGCSLAMLLV